jgi:hypothetical protein
MVSSEILEKANIWLFEYKKKGVSGYANIKA